MTILREIYYLCATYAILLTIRKIRESGYNWVGNCVRFVAIKIGFYRSRNWKIIYTPKKSILIPSKIRTSYNNLKGSTHGCRSLTTLIVKYYNDLLERQSSHTSMLGMFFVYILATSMLIFKKKSLRKFLGKSSKLFIVVTLQYNEKFGAFSQKSQQRFFLENRHT